MNPIVYHIAGGASFFTGVALLLTGAGLMSLEGRLGKRLGVSSFCLGAIAIAVSSTPLPYWLLALAMLVTLAWVVLLRLGKWPRCSTTALFIVWMAAASWEAAHWKTPQPYGVDARALMIIGDSVTAGMGATHEVTWPALFAEQHDIAVQNLSGSGFTTAQALARVEHEGVDAPLVLVEIGGNDLLNGRSSQAFREDLDALLSWLSQDGRQVVMLELPLIPFHGNYGRAQRSLARKHGVLLIPKRVFLNIIAPAEATVDTIHLTQQGHQAMADETWRVLSPAYEP